MDLQDFRIQIDRIDGEILELFAERMAVSRKIAEYKKARGLPVFDAARESEKLAAVRAKAGPEMQDYARELFAALIKLSRDYQNNYLDAASQSGNEA